MYNNVFDCIETLAHLPDNLDNVDRHKTIRLIEQTNQKLFDNTRERMLKNPNIISKKSQFCFLALHSIVDNCSGMKDMVDDLMDEYNAARGVKKTRNGRISISSPGYFDFDHYDSIRLETILNEAADDEFLRELSDVKKQEVFNLIAPDQNEVRKELKEIKDAQAKKIRSKEAPEKGEKKLKEEKKFKEDKELKEDKKLNKDKKKLDHKTKPGRNSIV